MLPQMILVFLGLLIMRDNNSVLQAGLRFDNRKIVSIENGTMGEEGYFKAVDKSLTALTLP
jgi:hypothetical protein